MERVRNIGFRIKGPMLDFTIYLLFKLLAS